MAKAQATLLALCLSSLALPGAAQDRSAQSGENQGSRPGTFELQASEERVLGRRTDAPASIRYEPYGGVRERDDTQTELLFSGRTTHGGYGAPQMRVTSVLSEPALLVGVHGGWIVNHSFVLGLAGYGLATRHDTPAAMRVEGEPSRMEFAYGGVRAAYLLFPHRLVHVGFGGLLGGGGLIAIAKEDYRNQQGNEDVRTAHADASFVFEPEVEVEVNVVHFMRIAVAGSYRIVGAVDAPGLTHRKLSAPSGSVAFKFGVF